MSVFKCIKQNKKCLPWQTAILPEKKNNFSFLNFAIIETLALKTFFSKSTFHFTSNIKHELFS